MKPLRCWGWFRILHAAKAALTAVAVTLALGLSAPATAATFTVAVVPQFPALEIHRAWAPVLSELSAQTGHEFKLTQFKTIPEFEAAFLLGAPDFVFLNPYHMVMARKAHGYKPLLREGKNMLSGVLVVDAAGPIRSIEQLDNQTVAFPAPNAFGASLYMRALLAQQKISIKPSYVGTHGNAYRNVLTGQSAAAGGIRATLEREAPEVRDALRVVYTTPSVAAHPFAAHPRVPDKEVAAVVRAWLQMAQAPVTEAMLRAVQMPHPVEADYKRDYAPLERLNLEKFAVVGGD